MKKKFAISILGILLTICASATTVIPLSVENLTSVSSHVVEARAISSSNQWNAAHTLISTYTTFQVERILKGAAPSILVVRQLGGTLDGTTEKVPGVRHWKIGEQAVLFLRPGETRDGSFEVTGLIQGNFLIYRGLAGESLVSNGAPDASAYEVSSSKVTAYKGSAMRLHDIEARVQKAMQKVGQ